MMSAQRCALFRRVPLQLRPAARLSGWSGRIWALDAPACRLYAAPAVGRLQREQELVRKRKSPGIGLDDDPLGADILAFAAEDEIEEAEQEDLFSGPSHSRTAEGVARGEVDTEGMGPRSAGPLARKMWNCARRGVRSEEVWAKFAHRVLMASAFMGAGDVALMFFAFARVKYRDVKALGVISPFILRYVEEFTLMELVLLLNAHKKLEYERIDNIQLLLTSICGRRPEWTGRAVALTANAVAYFYVYEPRFWKLVNGALPKVAFTMNPLELSNLVSAMARVDRREHQTLLLLAKLCARGAQRNLFSQETLATTMNAFAKLDFHHPKLSTDFQEAALIRIDRALELGPDYRKSHLKSDVFDLQALVLVFHTLVCHVGTSDDVVHKLLTLIAWSASEVSSYQRRLLKICCQVARVHHRDAFRGFSHDVKQAVHSFEHADAEVRPFESRWSRELRQTLQKMNIEVELKSVVDDQVLDIWLPTSQAVVCPLGPYSYYTKTTQRTAYSKLHQRLLEMKGYTCMPVPYYEWGELRTEEDKMVYLWSLGRRAAATKASGVKGRDVQPAVLPDEMLKSDLSDMDEARSL